MCFLTTSVIQNFQVCRYHGADIRREIRHLQFLHHFRRSSFLRSARISTKPAQKPLLSVQFTDGIFDKIWSLRKSGKYHPRLYSKCGPQANSTNLT